VKRMLFFNLPIRIYIQGYLLFTLGSFYNFKHISEVESEGISIATVVFFLFNIFSPYAVLWFILWYRGKTYQTQTKVLTRNLNITKTSSLILYFLFLIRRQVYAIFLEFFDTTWGAYF
jgi:hypothetical protein